MCIVFSVQFYIENDLLGALGDVSTSSKRRLEVRQNFIFFIANLAIFEYRLAVNVLTRPHEKIFFFKKFIFDLYTLYLTSDSCLNLIWGKVKISKNS